MARNSGKRLVVPAERARQGEIILRRRWQRLVFIAGLVALAVLAVAWRIAVA